MKKSIILLLFFINFAFAFEHGKMEVKVGVEIKGQSFGDEYFNGWSIEDFANFITSGEASELGINGNVWTDAGDFLNSTDLEILLPMLGVSLDPSSYATGDGGYTGYEEDGSASDRNIPIGQYISVRLRDEDGDGDFDKVYIFGPGGIEIEQSINSTDPLGDEDFLAWYQQNFGTDVPEEISDEVLFDYYEDLILAQENSIIGLPTSGDSGLTEAQKIAISASLAASLNVMIQNNYGTSSLPMPNVIYDSTKGGYAVHKNGIIFTTEYFFTLLLTDGDRMSTLMHEYTHFSHYMLGINNPVYNDDGGMTNIYTDLVPVRTTEEYNYEYNVRYLINKALYPEDSENVLKLQTNADMNNKYTYVCSNYLKEEIAARKAELKGEMDGLYVLSGHYRQVLTATLSFQQISVGRALEYERLNNYKPNGSPNY